MLAWNQNVFSVVGCQNPTYWDGATICSCSRSILLLTDDKCDLNLQEHPIVDKVLHLDCFQSFVHGKHDLIRIGHEVLGTFSFCNSSWKWKKVHRIFNETSIGFYFFLEEMPAYAIDDAYIPVWEACCALRSWDFGTRVSERIRCCPLRESFSLILDETSY